MLEVDFDINVTDLYDAIGKSDWDAASLACRRNPIEAETWVVRRDPEEGGENRSPVDGILWRFLPLHSACARRPPANFLRNLLNAYPEAASFKDDSGMYSLHYACGNRASRSVIKQLVDCFPLAVRKADPQGMFPIHYIAQWGPSEDGIVELLLDEYANGVTELNGEGMSPLDLCKERNFDEWKEVLAIMEGRPSTIEVKKSEKPPRSSSQPRDERHSSRTRAERLAVEERSSFRSRRASSRERAHDAGSAHLDIRDEISTSRRYNDECRTVPRSRRPASTARSTEIMDEDRPNSITCSLSSPRYHDMKTPRSSGRGHGFHFGQKTPRSSSGRSVEFDFENLSHSRESIMSRGSNQETSNPPPSPSLLNHLSEKERPDQQQIITTPRSSSGQSVEFSFENPSHSRESIASQGSNHDTSNRMMNPLSPSPFASNRPSSIQNQESSHSRRIHRFNPPPSPSPSFLNRLSEKEKLAQQKITTTPRSSSGSVEFSFENSSHSRESITSQGRNHDTSNRMTSPLPPSPSHRSHQSSSIQCQESSQSHRGHILDPPPSPSPSPSPSPLDRLSENEKLAQQQKIITNISQEKENAQHQVSMLQNDNNELRAKLANYEMELNTKLATFETIQTENANLRAKLTNCDSIQSSTLANFNTIHSENAQLHAKINTIQKQNTVLHSRLADLQEIQMQLSEIVDIAERREHSRKEASDERRKVLLEMLAAEEEKDRADRSNFLYKGDTLGIAFGQQIRSIDGLRTQLVERLMIGGGDEIESGKW